jgi:hypothetical protein
MLKWITGTSGAPQGSVHCRHCLKPFALGRIGVVCRSQRCGGVRDDTGVRGPRFYYAGEHGLWRDGELVLGERPCPFCECLGTLESVCPHCRQALEADQGEDQVLAVIGASASGKTHFLAAVLHQLLDGGAGGGEWAVDREERLLEPLRRRFLEPLFDELRVLPATPDRLDEELRLPLVHRRDGRRVLLVFRDLGGELFLQPERLARASFLRYAQGVVLMADPLAFPPGPAAERGWTPNGQPDALEVLRTYRRVLEAPERGVDERALPLLPAEKVLAVAVTKADLMLDRDHPFWNDGEGGAHLEPGYWRRRAQEGRAVAEWVRGRLDAELVAEAERFGETTWFFVSSLGFPHPPDAPRLEQAPRPRRVHEPVFALLDRLTAGAAAARRPVDVSDEAEGEPEPAPAPPAVRRPAVRPPVAKHRRAPASARPAPPPEDDWDL